jgi:predicted MFS family arabinose efflux permease
VPLPAGLRALASRDFRIYYAGNLVAQIGTWMQTVTQSWLVLQLTDSPFLLGLTATLQFGPILVLSIFAGVLADRLTKRNILIFTQAAQGTLALTLGLMIWQDRVQYWHVAAMAVLWGVMSALDQPTRQSFIMELVGRDHLVSAVGMNSASFNAARIVGPSVAGLLIARVGLFAGFLINAGAFVVSIAALSLVPARRPLPRPTAATFLEAMAQGVAYAARTRVVRFLLSLQVIVSFCVFNFTVYVPLLARNVLGLGSEGFGFLMACLGVGAVTAGLSVGAVGSRPPLRLIATAATVACAGLLGLAVTRWFWLAAVLLAMIGFAGTVVVAGCNTSLQLAAPDALRGRVMSLYTLLSGGIFPIGAFFVGTLSQSWGVSAAFAVNGGLGLSALAAILWLRRARPR